MKSRKKARSTRRMQEDAKRKAESDMKRKAKVFDKAMKLNERLKAIPFPTIAGIDPKFMESTVLMFASMFMKPSIEKEAIEKVGFIRLTEYAAEQGATRSKLSFKALWPQEEREMSENKKSEK